MEKINAMISLTEITIEQAARLYPDNPKGYAIGFNHAVQLIESMNKVDHRFDGVKAAENADIFINIKPNK